NRTIAELTTLTVTNNAMDVDVPANMMTYSLLDAPFGAAIDTNGLITWTPTEAQGPSTNTITTIVSDGALSVTNSFVVTVTEVNVVPVFVVLPTNRTIAELTTLAVTNNATDADLPGNTLTYSLLDAPFGAAIDTNGLITWTPTEAQGPSTNTISTVVSDGALSTTNSFVVTVTEVNVAPVFIATPTNRTIAELTTLTLTNAATDADIPANLLTYSLLNPPGGASIDASGVITWTPAEKEGPEVITITTVVSDGLLSATNSFVVTVAEVNVAPVFSALPTSHTIAELATLMVTNKATDADIPANLLTYSLQNPPAGATIDANGVITWTPTESQGPSTNTITTVVSDGAASATNSFEVVVTEVNVAPAFVETPANRTIAELATLTVTNAATDADVPANTLTYSLQNPPGGAVIDTNGVITWTPDESQGPSTNTITTVVSDGALSATNSFEIVVTEMNSSPVLPAQGNLVVPELSTLTVTNTATDADVPANVLSYQLINAPAGASISAAGVISWIPTESQGPSTNELITVVSDGALSATNGFIVIVTEVNSAPVLQSIANRVIHAGGRVSLHCIATDPDGGANNLQFSFGVIPPAGATINSTNGNFVFATTDADANTTNSITVQVLDDGLPPLGDAKSFTVTVVGKPVITSVFVTNEVAVVTWSSITGQAYRLQSTDGLTAPVWMDEGDDVIADGAVAVQTNSVSGTLQRFYRVRLAP
ncbi:MAG: hypothetical protein HOP33_08165, partial [Verrucomicrobia bacterium]|nr:hypothetical protein [Verrucomicrobiota bacterium]